MSIFKSLNIRPVQNKDIPQLDAWRRQYTPAFLELPKGLNAMGVETAVAEKNNQIIGSLTGIHAAIFDPFIKNPEAKPLDIFAAVFLLERSLALNAQKGGAVDGYIAIPTQLEEYCTIVEKAGYEETCKNCKIYRRPFQPDTVLLIENGG